MPVNAIRPKKEKKNNSGKIQSGANVKELNSFQKEAVTFSHSLPSLNPPKFQKIWFYKEVFQKFVQNFQSLGSSLDAAGIHEHSDSAAQRRGREVAPESGADNATATVGAGHLAPNNTELGSILLGLGLVNVSQPLSKVPVNFLRCVHTFDLEERGAGVLVRFRPASPEMNY